MKIVIVSDTHGQHRNIKIPNGDILIYCGDYTAMDSFRELADFNNWLGTLPHPNKLFVAGNHDQIYQTNPHLSRLMLSNATVLHNESIIIDGIKFYGSSIQPVFNNWAFNIPDKDRKQYWDKIPEDTDILITHCPPYGTLDNVTWYNSDLGTMVEHVGDLLLADRTKELKCLKAHCFGHIHDGNWDGVGPKKIKKVKKNNTTYINGAIMDDNYRVNYKPIVINL